MTEPGFEVIQLDLSGVPTVEQGLADAAERYGRFTQLAKDSVGFELGSLLFDAHIPLMSFVNRAVSLHAGIVSAVEAANPHAAFTLLRAYLELVATIHYLDAHPDYIEALKKPMTDLPKGTRKLFSEMFSEAAAKMPGIRNTYAVLNEMAHFGSTALWHPFNADRSTATDGYLGTLSYATGPHWKNPEEDPRIALAMLAESDDATLVLLRLYDEHHIVPLVEHHAPGE